MIKLEKPNGWGDWLRLYRLYMQAFPAAERKPWRTIRKMYEKGKADVWCVKADGNFAGLAITVNSPNVILLDFFAISKKQRGQGIGTKALKAILARYADKGFFLEIESTLEESPDRAMRLRRKKFYLSCGLEEMHTTAFLFGVKMELLGVKCHLNFDQYKAFYATYYNAWAADHITSAE